MPKKQPVSVVSFHFQHQGFTLKNRRKLKSFIVYIFKKEKTRAESLQCIFCSDQQLLKINQQYLKHNYYTDIISFNLADKEQPVQGELYISLDRVKDNARILHNPGYMELHRVIFHGILHLCGYQDKTPGDKAEMSKKENYYLEQYFDVPRITVS